MPPELPQGTCCSSEDGNVDDVRHGRLVSLGSVADGQCQPVRFSPGDYSLNSVGCRGCHKPKDEAGRECGPGECSGQPSSAKREAECAWLAPHEMMRQPRLNPKIVSEHKNSVFAGRESKRSCSIISWQLLCPRTLLHGHTSASPH